MFVENGANTHADNAQQRTPLHLVAGSSQEEAVEVLLEGGADIEARDVLYRTPLHRAACHHRCGAARALFERGALVNARDVVGFTPLHCVAARASEKHGAAGMVDLLLRSGADETIIDADGAIAADVNQNIVREEETSLLENVERVRNLLANAPCAVLTPAG